MTKPAIDLRGSKYRLEARHDHIDYLLGDVEPGNNVYLRYYATVEDRKHADKYGTITRDSSAVVATIRSGLSHSEETLRFGGWVFCALSTPLAAQADNLQAIVAKMITMHQLSGAGMDTRTFNSFMQKRGAPACPIESQ